MYLVILNEFLPPILIISTCYHELAEASGEYIPTRSSSCKRVRILSTRMCIALITKRICIYDKGQFPIFHSLWNYCHHGKQAKNVHVFMSESCNLSLNLVTC